MKLPSIFYEFEIYLILLSVLLALFVTACATKPKDTASASGSGSTSSESSVSASSDESEVGESIEPGSQEDLIVNVGDRVFFGYDRVIEKVLSYDPSMCHYSCSSHFLTSDSRKSSFPSRLLHLS